MFKPGFHIVMCFVGLGSPSAVVLLINPAISGYASPGVLIPYFPFGVRCSLIRFRQQWPPLFSKIGGMFSLSESSFSEEITDSDFWMNCFSFLLINPVGSMSPYRFLLTQMFLGDGLGMGGGM